MHQLARHDAFREDSALVVDVLQEQIDRGEPLRQATFDRAPFAGRDDAWQQIVREDALGPGFVSVDGERDALGQERLVGVGLPLAELRQRGCEQVLDERAALRPRLSGRVQQLVVRVIEGVPGEDLSGRTQRDWRRTGHRGLGHLRFLGSQVPG